MLNLINLFYVRNGIKERKKERKYVNSNYCVEKKNFYFGKRITYYLPSVQSK